MRKIFVSGTFEILHGGHVRFFEEAKALGDYLIVSFASDAVLMAYKGRKATLPEKHRRKILEGFKAIDEVVMGTNVLDPIFDFKDDFIRLKPTFLVSTEDDKHVQAKVDFCKQHGATYIQLGKSLDFPMISTTEIRRKLCE